MIGKTRDIHEKEIILSMLAQGLCLRLVDAQRLKSYYVAKIDTSKCNESEVSNLISDFPKKFFPTPFQEKWIKIQ